MKTRFIIYCHTCRVNGKQYIGQTRQTMEKRWSDHVKLAKRSVRVGCRALASAIMKYGADAFDHEILDVVTSQEGANIAERVWIEKRRTTCPNGYNIAPVGNAAPLHPETIRRASEAQKRRWANASEEQRAPMLENLRRGREGLSFEQLSDRSLRAHAAQTPEQRSQRQKKAWASVPAARRLEIVAQLLKNKASDPEMSRKISDGKKRDWARLTPEQKAERVRRIAEASWSPEARRKRGLS
ncbi:MAG TPA: GIY-YIG nuclease family protein [Gemmatimonadaceae bacterium]|jgi:group I intron endonuclease|nr:GIY-YIG nuclease family protein [Gemmatimonadaceae bacterium]